MVVHAPLDYVNYQIHIKWLHTSHPLRQFCAASNPLHSIAQPFCQTFRVIRLLLFCINTQTLCRLTSTLCFSVTSKKSMICYDLIIHVRKTYQLLLYWVEMMLCISTNSLQNKVFFAKTYLSVQGVSQLKLNY